MGRTEADAEFDDFAMAAWPRLRWAAYLMCGEEHLAEALAQNALTKTYASWRRVRRADAWAYTRKVMVNANIDRMRRRRVTEVAVDRDERADSPEADRAADRAELAQLLARLTPQERRVLVLRHYFDLSEAAVADELGVTVGTVRSTSSRALAKLRSARPDTVGATGA